MIIKLNTVDDIGSFVSICKIYDNDYIDVKQGRQVIDGKSILGIYSLNLINTLEVDIDTKNKDVREDFYKKYTKVGGQLNACFIGIEKGVKD